MVVAETEGVLLAGRHALSGPVQVPIETACRLPDDKTLVFAETERFLWAG